MPVILLVFVGGVAIASYIGPTTKPHQQKPSPIPVVDKTVASLTPVGNNASDAPGSSYDWGFYPSLKAKSKPAPARKIDESQSPAGRYHKVVFNELTSFKDISFKDSYLTKFTVDEGVYTLDFDTSLPVQRKLNVYMPRGDQVRSRPLLIFMYGGAWTYGDRYQREPEAQYYASLGYVTMTFDYTMIPPGTESNPVPDDQQGVYGRLIAEGINDLDAAYRYMIDHHAQYGVDVNRIGVGGWSVGGLMSNAWVHTNFTPTPYGVKASLPASSIFPNILADGFGGFREFNSSYNPVSFFASYQDDHEQNGPFSPETDCAELDAIGHRCTSTLFPGDFHDISFHLAPLLDPARDFFATNVAGY